MNAPLRSALAVAGLALATTSARAQFTIDWYTIDGGGGRAVGGTLDLNGTIGQPDAGSAAGGPFQINGGFWTGVATPQACYANCDNSTAPPILNVNDFICFQQRFAAGDSYANCDGSTSPPVLNVNDFICFQARFVAGCS
jgi:hypothetical protein